MTQIEVDESQSFLLMVDNGDGSTTTRIAIRNSELPFDYTFVSEGTLEEVLTMMPTTPEMQAKFDERTILIPNNPPEEEQ